MPPPKPKRLFLDTPSPSQGSYEPTTSNVSEYAVVDLYRKRESTGQTERIRSSADFMVDNEIYEGLLKKSSPTKSVVMVDNELYS